MGKGFGDIASIAGAAIQSTYKWMVQAVDAETPIKERSIVHSEARKAFGTAGLDPLKVVVVDAEGKTDTSNVTTEELSRLSGSSDFATQLLACTTKEAVKELLEVSEGGTALECTVPLSVDVDVNTPAVITVSDFTGGPAIGYVEVTLQAQHGVVTLSGFSTIRGFFTGDGTADPLMDFVCDPASLAINIGSLTYLPDEDYVGSDTVTLAIADGTNTLVKEISITIA